MIDFTIDEQSLKKTIKTKPLILGEENGEEKIFLLHMMINTTKNNLEEESRRIQKY